MEGLIVFLGGGLGAFVRYILYLVLPKLSYFPLGTLAANFLGCLIATLVFVYLVSKSEVDSIYRTFLIFGFCGGLSTLSALSLELFEFIYAGEFIRAILYTCITVVTCTISVLTGIILAKYILSFKI